MLYANVNSNFKQAVSLQYFSKLFDLGISSLICGTNNINIS